MLIRVINMTGVEHRFFFYYLSFLVFLFFGKPLVEHVNRSWMEYIKHLESAQCSTLLLMWVHSLHSGLHIESSGLGIRQGSGLPVASFVSLSAPYLSSFKSSSLSDSLAPCSSLKWSCCIFHSSHMSWKELEMACVSSCDALGIGR